MYAPAFSLREVSFGLQELDMANTRSAKKMVRKIAARTEVNKARRSRVRTYVRKVEEAIAAGDKSAAQDALRVAQPELMRAVTKGVMHKNTSSRKVSRLSARVSAMG
jgi:small subunit ribosomal protein S20